MKPEDRKNSKKYTDKPYLYWWDFTPGFVERSKQYKKFHFVGGNSGTTCTISTRTLSEYFTEDRRTSRSGGTWGVKVFRDRPNELAFEPGKGSKEWLFLKVHWEGR